MQKQIEKTDIVLGKVLRKLRNDAKLSQEQLALDAGLERTYISMLELGQRTPTIKTLIKLSHALNIQLSDLIKQFEVAYKEHNGQEINHKNY